MKKIFTVLALLLIPIMILSNGFSDAPIPKKAENPKEVKKKTHNYRLILNDADLSDSTKKAFSERDKKRRKYHYTHGVGAIGGCYFYNEFLFRGSLSYIFNINLKNRLSSNFLYIPDYKSGKNEEKNISYLTLSYQRLMGASSLVRAYLKFEGGYSSNTVTKKSGNFRTQDIRWLSIGLLNEGGSNNFKMTAFYDLVFEKFNIDTQNENESDNFNYITVFLGLGFYYTF